MAVTNADLAVALGIIGAADEAIDDALGARLKRSREAASTLLMRIAPAAPEAVMDEALVRYAGYLWDSDPSRRFASDPVMASGAGALLARWRHVTVASNAVG